jgi:hypothetical protein
MTDENIVQLSVAHDRKQQKRKKEAGDLLFDICRIVMMPRRDRLEWVRECEKAYGFSVLEKFPAKKKTALKLVK